MLAGQSAPLHFGQVATSGYGGEITLALALDNNNCIRAIAALRHNETVDVGAPLLASSALRRAAVMSNATSNAGWLQQWRSACPIAKGSQTADAIDNVTGATLTSRAVATALAGWRRNRQ